MNFTINMEQQQYTGRGGWRGGGRPKSEHPKKLVSLKLTEQAIERLNSLTKNKSQFVENLIMSYEENT